MPVPAKHCEQHNVGTLDTTYMADTEMSCVLMMSCEKTTTIVLFI